MKRLSEDSVTDESRRITHDLSNQILVVQGNLELLRMKLPLEGKLESHLELASDAAERCRGLIERLSELWRESEPRS